MSDTQFFVYKLIPPRPSFAMDMSEQERAVMTDHGIYWRGLLQARTCVVFGPVLDPAGVWGLAVVEAATADDVMALGRTDPAVASGTCTFEVFPMMGATARG